MENELHIEGTDPMARLKALTPEEVESLESQRNKLSAAGFLMHLSVQHGIRGLSAQGLQDFWRWRSEQRVLQRMNQDADSFQESFCTENPAATMHEAHKATLAFLHLKAAREDNEPLMRFVLTEIRRARALEQTTERLKMMERRLEMLERRSAAARKTLSDETMTNEQRAQRLREVFGLS